MNNWKLETGSLLVILILLFLVPQSVYAFNTSLPNNKYGIHLAQPDPNDLKKSAELVNSNGGAWGYVTLVLQENDRNQQKWQGIFNQLRELRLIPIIRLATQPEGSVWSRPQKSDIQAWVSFLNSLNWVVKDRYIILFNEPNHATEWGGEVDAQHFRDVSYEFASVLKKAHPDYFIMLAGMDAAAPQSLPNYQDEASFLEIIFRDKKLQEVIDGWSSHSYPNPGFSGSPYATGRNSIQTYDWELSYLRSLGVTKELPVFITETGWHNTNNTAFNFTYAFEHVWLRDARVRAVTPFVLKYPQPPFTLFTWLNADDSRLPHFDTVLHFAKPQGNPEIIDTAEIEIDKPSTLVERSLYRVPVTVTNTGQRIWNAEDAYTIEVLGEERDVQIIPHLNPQEKTVIPVIVKTTGSLGKRSFEFQIKKDKTVVATSGVWTTNIVPFPNIDIRAQLFGKRKTNGDDFTLQIFNKREELIYERNNITITNGRTNLDRIENIVIKEKYRVVLLKPYYLPRQTFVTFKEQKNEAIFEIMYLIDFNKDGDLSSKDFEAVLQKPSLLGMWMP